MEQLLLVVAVLACPVGMGLMMWFMMRGRREQPATPGQEQELARLRAQIEALRPAPAEDAAASGNRVPERTPGHQHAVHRHGPVWRHQGQSGPHPRDREDNLTS